MTVEQQNSIYIDPSECGSNVGYYITTNEWTSSKDNKTTYNLNAIVVLTDCNHKIDWVFSLDGGEEKIDKVITMLQEFRKKYIETAKLIAKFNKK